MGTVEQAANGTALSVCSTILKDFVSPKLLKVQWYVICQLVGMANHDVGAGGEGGGGVFFGLPPIRQWDIDALEVACGRKVGPGRLEKLDQAGLLGRESNLQHDASSSYVEAANEMAEWYSPVPLAKILPSFKPCVLGECRRSHWEFSAQVSPENERAAGDWESD